MSLKRESHEAHDESYFASFTDLTIFFKQNIGAVINAKRKRIGKKF